MSQTRTRTQVRHAANVSIVDMLEERLLETESTNYKYTLRKALRAIRALREPIVSKEEALKIPGVGNHIATQIHIHLLEQPSTPAASSVGGPTMPEPGAVLLPEEPEPEPAPTSHRRPRARAPRQKEYMPQYRSTPYGILIALFHAESSGITAMRKDDLARSAQQYAERPILTQGSDDPTTWYDGWSSVNRTLVSKGLVARGGNPIKFSLSAMGRELAERLVEMNNEVLDAGAREYRADRSIPVGTGSLPRRVTTPGSRSGTNRSAPQNTGGPSRSPPTVPSNPSQNLSQQESDTRIPQATARTAAEHGAGIGDEPVVNSQPTGSASRIAPQARVEPETAATLNRKYSAGREFGNASPDASQPPEPSRPASQARRKKLTQAQCDRTSKAIHRLEAGGYSRADCIKIAEILHVENAFPRSVDGIYQAIVNALWEIEKQERGLQRNSGAIGLTISAMDSSDNDDDAVFRYQSDKTGGAPSRKPSDHDRIREVSQDPAYRPSSSNTPQTFDLSASSDDSLLDPLLDSSRANAVQQLPNGNPNNGDDSRELPFRQPGSSNVGQFSDRNSNLRGIPRCNESCPSSPDMIAPEPPQKRKGENVPNGEVVVIDLDVDSPKVPSCAPSSSQKRPRATDVIALDTDDEDDVLEIPKSTTTRQPFLSSCSQTLSRPNGDLNKVISESSATQRNMYPIATLRQEQQNQRHLPRENAALDTCSNYAVDDLRVGHGEGCKIILLLDCMERFRNSDTMAGHVRGPGELLLDEGVDCEVRPLPAGDALFIARFPDNTEIVLDYIIERKTIDDYGASMKDGRVARQSYMMRRATIKRRVFLLEGDLKENEDLYNKTELHKKLAEMTMCSGLYVRHTRDIQDTVHFYASLYRRLQKKFVSQTKTATLRERSLFPDWNEKMNSMKKTISMEQLFMIQLCTISGLGTTKAQAIVDMGYKTPFLLYAAYKELDSREEQDELLNKGELAIGCAGSKAVSHLFNQRQYSTIVKRSPHK